jgi:hypothetical protein
VFERGTYGRSFFFGPGLPRGLGTPSTVICDALRFMPGFGPGIPFRFTPLGGGASKLLFEPPVGFGVELESDTLPEGDASATALDCEAFGLEDDEDDFGCDGFEAGTSVGKVERRSGERWRVSSKDFAFAALEEAFAAEAEMADDMVDAGEEDGDGGEIIADEVWC